MKKEKENKDITFTEGENLTETITPNVFRDIYTGKFFYLEEDKKTGLHYFKKLN